VRFKSLTREQISEIVDMQVARVIARVAERGVQVTLTDEARELIANMGYDPTYGARRAPRDSEAAGRSARVALLAGEIAKATPCASMWWTGSSRLRLRAWGPRPPPELLRAIARHTLKDR